MKDFIVSGKYDLVILDNDSNKFKHLIEVKRLKDIEIHPEKANRHRPLEDIYVLTDLPKEHLPHSEELDKNHRGYNLIFVKSEKQRKEDDYKKMKIFLDDIKKAYKNAGIYYLAIGIDNDLKKNAKGKSITFEDIQCGKGNKHRTSSKTK